MYYLGESHKNLPLQLDLIDGTIWAFDKDLELTFHLLLILIGMREGTFHTLSFMDQNFSAEFLSKISKHF